MKNKAEIDRLIAKAEEEFAKLNLERAKVTDRLQKLRHARSKIDHLTSQLPLTFSNPPLTNDSSEDAKITLYRTFFRGREDVYQEDLKALKPAGVDTNQRVKMSGSGRYVRSPK